MAYIPSIDDIEQSSSYKPSLDDIHELSSPQQMSAIPRIASDIVGGIATAGQGIANAPHNIVNMFSPSIASHIPYDSTNYMDFLGPQNPNLGDKLIQNASQYAPYAIGGEAALAGKGLAAMPAWMGKAAPIAANATEQGGIGGLFGATQSDDPGSSALQDAGLNAGLTGGFGGISAVGKSLWNGTKNYLSQFAAKGLSNNIADSMNQTKGLTNQQAFDMAKNNFDNYTAKEKAAWDNLTDQVKNSEISGAKFDNSDYTKSLQDKLQTLNDQSGRQSAFARANSDSQDLLQGYLKDKHDTFADAIEHNKALNQDYQNEITPGKSLPFSTVNFAKQGINKTIGDNIESNGLQDTLGDAWTAANKSTSDKNKIFNQVVNVGGRDQISKFSGLLKNKSENVDPTGFVSDYVPTARGDGIQKMQQFSQMIGNDEAAKNILKMNYFDTAYKNDSIDTDAFLNKFNKLSDSQRNYLFNQNESNSIQALNHIVQNHPEVLARANSRAFLAHSIPALLGAGLGHALGAGEVTGGLLGLVGAQAAKAGLNKAFSNPSISNYFVNNLLNQKPVNFTPARATTMGLAATPAWLNNE